MPPRTFPRPVSPARRPVLGRRRGAFGLAALATLAASAALLTGCSNETSDRDLVLLGTDDAVAASRGQSSLFRGSQRATFLDPRLEREFLAEHIPGALHVPIQELRERRDELEDWDVIIVYGNTFKDPIAIAAAKTLQSMNVAEIRVMEGGLKAWTADERPTGTGRGDAASTPSGG